MRIDVIHARLGIGLGEEHRHRTPPARPRKVLQDPPGGVVVVRHEGLLIRVALVGPRPSRVIARQVQVHELREVGHRVDFADELGDARLVGDVNVEAGILPRRAIVQRRGHGRVSEEARTQRRHARPLAHARKLQALAEIVKGDAVLRQVLPHRTGLSLVFRQDRRGGTGKCEAARRGESEVLGLSERGGNRTRCPRVRIRAHQPVMPVDAGVPVGIEIVAEGPLPGDGVVVGRHVSVAQADAHVPSIDKTAGAQVRQLRGRHHRTVGSLRHVAQDVVERATFLDDQHHVADLGRQLSSRRRGMLLESVSGHHERRVRRQVRCLGHGKDRHGTVQALARQHRSARAVGRARPLPVSLRGGNKHGVAIDRRARGIPGCRQVPEYAARRHVDHADRVDSRFSHQQPARFLVVCETAGRHAAQRFEPGNTDGDRIQHAIGPRVDHGDGIAAGVGHEHAVRCGGDTRRADAARRHQCLYLGRRGIGNVDHAEGVRLRRLRVAHTGHFHRSASGGTLDATRRLRTGKPERRECQSGRARIAGIGIRKGSIFKQPRVRDVELLPIG